MAGKGEFNGEGDRRVDMGREATMGKLQNPRLRANAYFHISCVRLHVYGMEAPWCLRPIAMENRLASFSEYHREIIGDSILR